MKPSEFKEFPYDSVLKKTEAEIVARNIMTILDRTKDIFRKLSWKEYTEERKKDGNFTQGEKFYFDKVINYFKSVDTVKSFSSNWKI